MTEDGPDEGGIDEGSDVENDDREGHEAENGGDEADEAENAEGEEFEIERTATRAEAAALLHDLADGVASGSVAFDDGAVVVDLPETVELEVEYEEDTAESEIEVELEWPTDEVDTDDADEEVEDGGADVVEAGDANEEIEDGGVDQGFVESTTAVESTLAGVVEPGEEATSRARFELYRDRGDKWRWRLVHHNGNIIADGGGGYARKANARKGLESVKRNSPGALVVEKE